MLKFFREDVAAGIHRDTEYSNLVDTGYDEYSIDGVGVVVVRLKSDQQWWIIPDSCSDNDIFDDRGPFDTAEAAFAVMRLSAKKT